MFWSSANALAQLHTHTVMCCLGRTKGCNIWICTGSHLLSIHIKSAQWTSCEILCSTHFTVSSLTINTRCKHTKVIKLLINLNTLGKHCTLAQPHPTLKPIRGFKLASFTDTHTPYFRAGGAAPATSGPGELVWLLWPWPDQYLLGFYSRAYRMFCSPH